MDRLVSLHAAIDEVKRLHDVAWANWRETRISANMMIDALKDLPSADRPTGEWIPCSERLPETIGEYEVTVLLNPSKNRISTTLFYHNGWWIGREKINSVIAWREKPEPYKGGEQRV